MIKTTNIRAAKKFGPGYFIKEQMEIREWTQEDLASVLGVTIKHVNKILSNKQTITLDMAKIFGEVFNTSVQYWINLDTEFRLWLHQEKSVKETEADLKAVIYERMPINDMIRKGWLKKHSSVKELTENVLNYWNWNRLDFSSLDSNLLPYLTKRSEAYNQFNASYALTWFQKASSIATGIESKLYLKDKLSELYESLHEYSYNENGINNFISDLYSCGVKFFVLPHLQKTYLDGAAFFSNNNPVIVYTARYKRIDNFWFTIAHEIAHILNHLDETTPFVLDNFMEKEMNEIETEANRIAADKLKYAEIRNILEPHLNYLTTKKIEECSKHLVIHPAIIVGKLAHDKVISYRNQNLYNSNVTGIIEDEYIYN